MAIPVHGLADKKIMVLSFFLGSHISLLSARAASVNWRPPADVASCFSVMRILSQLALSGDSCPMTESSPLHHSMHLLGVEQKLFFGFDGGSELSFSLDLAS